MSLSANFPTSQNATEQDAPQPGSSWGNRTSCTKIQEKTTQTSMAILRTITKQIKLPKKVFTGDYGRAYGDFSDFFEQHFLVKQKRQDNPPHIKGQDLHGEMKLSFEEAYSGTSRILTTIDHAKIRISTNPGSRDGQTLKNKGNRDAWEVKQWAKFGDCLCQVDHCCFTIFRCEMVMTLLICNLPVRLFNKLF